MEKRQLLTSHLVLIPLSGVAMFISGLASTYLYCRYYHTEGFLFPGIIYTSTTLFLSAFVQAPLQLKGIIIYYLLMIALYAAVWLLTWLSSWFAMFAGLITGGIGSMSSLYLFRKFITPIKFDAVKSLIPGAIAFAMVDILGLCLEDSFFPGIFGFNGFPETLFADIIVIWQVLVGVYLMILISRYNLIYGTQQGFGKSRGVLALPVK